MERANTVSPALNVSRYPPKGGEKNTLVLSQFTFAEFQSVMPAQAGIQKNSALAYRDPPWIPAFAGMTFSMAIQQNFLD